MRINVCVNGSFRYPQFIRWYAQAGVLGDFHFAHRRATTAARIGLPKEAAHNGWVKEYALQAAARGLPGVLVPAAERVLCDGWQRAVIRRWRDCDSVEAVLGAVADRVIARAKVRGAAVLGHPVCAHPETVAANVGRAYLELGLDPAQACPSAPARRMAEIACCDRILADSRAVARSYIEAGVPAARVSVVTPAVDTTRFHPRRGEDQERAIFRVVCVASITPRKAQHVLLEAWRRLGPPPGAELVLVGLPGAHAAAVLRGFDGLYRHIRRVPNPQLRALLVTASAFVLPSAEDGFGQVVLEAMGCGLPVIVTGTVGAADCVTDGQDGFIVPPFDPDAVADRLERFLRAPDLARAMGEAAARTAARHGDWRAYVGRVLDIHRALVPEPQAWPRAAA